MAEVALAAVVAAVPDPEVLGVASSSTTYDETVGTRSNPRSSPRQTVVGAAISRLDPAGEGRPREEKEGDVRERGTCIVPRGGSKHRSAVPLSKSINTKFHFFIPSL